MDENLDKLNWQTNTEYKPLTKNEIKEREQKVMEAKAYVGGVQEEFNSFVKIDDLLNDIENTLLEVNDENYNDLKEQIEDKILEVKKYIKTRDITNLKLGNSSFGDDKYLESIRKSNEFIMDKLNRLETNFNKLKEENIEIAVNPLQSGKFENTYETRNQQFDKNIGIAKEQQEQQERFDNAKANIEKDFNKIETGVKERQERQEKFDNAKADIEKDFDKIENGIEERQNMYDTEMKEIENTISKAIENGKKEAELKEKKDGLKHIDEKDKNTYYKSVQENELKIQEIENQKKIEENQKKIEENLIKAEYIALLAAKLENSVIEMKKNPSSFEDRSIANLQVTMSTIKIKIEEIANEYEILKKEEIELKSLNQQQKQLNLSGNFSNEVKRKGAKEKNWREQYQPKQQDVRNYREREEERKSQPTVQVNER